jgi:hypothetical protein
MIIVKIISFILATILLIKAILKEDFSDLFLAIILFYIAFGIEKIM